VSLWKQNEKIKTIPGCYFYIADRICRLCTLCKQKFKKYDTETKSLKAIYPAWMWYAKMRGKNVTELSNEQKQPPVSFYTLKGTLNNGTVFDFSSLKAKK
jgi:hypothetical protein